MNEGNSGNRPESYTQPLQYSPQAFTILATYRCTAMCSNCCFDSNPWLKERLTLNEIIDLLNQAAELPRLELVGFSGGECFLLGEDLNKAVAHAKQKGLRTRCITNGYWAQSRRSGRRRLDGLKRAGLDELNISTGDFHQQYVDQSTVITAAELAIELSVEKVLIVVEQQKHRSVSVDALMQDDRVRRLSENAGFGLIESPWMPMNAEEVIDQPPGGLLNKSNVSSRQGCRSVLTTLVVTPSKKLGFCCGLSREHIPELNAKIDSSLGSILSQHASDFLKIWLFVDGPERILAWAATKLPELQWEDKYGHQCHACLAVFSNAAVRDVIRCHYHERVTDVLMRYNMLVRSQVMSAELRQ